MGLSGGEEKAAHVLVIPSPGQGHIAPLLRLAKQLARKGVTISFVVYKDFISRRMSAELSSELQSLDIRIVGLDHSGPEGANLPSGVANKLREAFKPYMAKLVQDKSSGVAGPTSILSDMFLTWTQDAADELQIPRYMFVPSGILFARTMQGVVDLHEKGLLRSGADGNLAKFDGSVCIPGLRPLRYYELPFCVREDTADFLLRSKSIWQSAGVLANSFYELEEKIVETWRRPGDSTFEHTKVPKLYPIGPLFSASVIQVPDITAVHGLEDSAQKSLLWLGSQPSSSVLYVAFGSAARLSPEHISELALGLEGSKQRFLWVIPMSKDGSNAEIKSIIDVLPPGFEERLRDRGCIVTGWVPQLQILAHPSTAAFLTHCGWNSTLESIMMGVPMVTWPRSAEQHLNCRYVTDDLRIADQIQTGAENIVERKEVERAVRLVMEESEGKAMRSRVEELQRKGAGAVAQGGSQVTFFQEYLDDISIH